MSNISYKHFIYDHELMLYPYAPLGLLHNQGEWPVPKYNLSIVVSASSKDLNIIEWVCYHQALGVQHIYLYCTDDDPTDLYRQIIPFTLGKKPFITFHHYRFSKSNTQLYFHFIRNYLHETEWYINLDIDDYLYIHEKQTLSAFLNSFINTNAVYFNMVLFDNKGEKESANLQEFFQQNQPVNHPCIYTKLMVRSQSCPYQYLFYNLDKKIDHHIQEENLIDYSCNVLQQNMKYYYENFPYSALDFINSNTQAQIVATAYIAHFCNSNDLQKDIDTLSTLYTGNKIKLKYQDDTQTINLHHYTPNKYWEKTLKNVWKQSLLPAPLPLLSILSNDKPCQQSSTPGKSTTEELAKNLISGQLHGTTQTITKKENNPWWEIDLQQSFIIKNIRLFNSIDLNIKNMNHFIIESSEDYETWIKRHQKIIPKLFGGGDGTYYNWIHPLGIKARWIRITAPGDNKIFSLDQIQILGIEHKNFYIP